MFRKICALIFLLCFASGTSWGAVDYIPFDYSPEYINSADQYAVYSRFGNAESGYFFYQLRDVTGASRSDQVAGPQWFATVYENYYNRFFYEDNDQYVNTGIYRRTMGGETPEVPFSVVGDILDGFNFVFAEEPQPYNAWTNLVALGVYDIYPDPLESLCIVITNGQGNIDVKFGNPYARHFPFWWGWNGTTGGANWTWWRNNYDWRTARYATVEPIAYIYNPGDRYIYERNSSNNYVQAYVYTTSNDMSGDMVLRTRYYIDDLSGNHVYTISGDVNSRYYVYDDSNNLAFTVSDDRVYNSSNSLVYTLESDGTSGSIYICSIRDVNESIRFSGFENYSMIIDPNIERPISSGNYLNASVRIRGTDTGVYGSELGYITFRQRASFATGYSNYREYTTIPVVIANVSNGNASTNPLLFDMIVFNENNEIVNRIKFTWDAQDDMPDQDLGTFFMMRPYHDTTQNTYRLETRITNRTGTRYELFRYDMIGRGNQDAEYRGNYRYIRPYHWEYDLTQDMYGTLPDSFLLDAHSQIAPGLVTVYNSDVGFSTLDTQYDTQESFRLYEYSNSAPKNLRLNYKRVAGMTTATDGRTQTLGGNRVSLRGFSMQFADVANNENNTVRELTNLMGKAPFMVSPDMSNLDSGNNDCSVTYIKASAIDPFQINKSVPEDIRGSGLVSYDIISDETESGDVQNSAVFAAAQTITSARAALQPVSVRMIVPRQSQLLANRWEALDSAGSSRELFDRFSRYGTIWVRSDAASEQDTNLFTAINRKGADIGVSAGDCVRAFIYEDNLYLDFIVLLADAQSKEAGKTAFIEIFKDDDVPYILIGDGSIDMSWNIKFFVDATGENPIADPVTPTNPENKPSVNNTSENIGGSSGGGCNISFFGIMSVLLLVAALKK